MRSAEGPSDVLVKGSTYYVLLQTLTSTRRARTHFGPDGATAGDLISSPAGKGPWDTSRSDGEK